jgi:hypothetical protein
MSGLGRRLAGILAKVLGIAALHWVTTIAVEFALFACFKERNLICGLTGLAGFLVSLPLGPLVYPDTPEVQTAPGAAFYLANSLAASAAIVLAISILQAARDRKKCRSAP